MAPKSKDFYTIQEFADYIGVHYLTIWKGVKRGHIQSFRVGPGQKSSYRIPKTEINRMSLFNLESVIENLIEKRKQT